VSEPVNVSVSSGSTTVSPLTWTSIVVVVSPGAKVTVSAAAA